MSTNLEDIEAKIISLLTANGDLKAIYLYGSVLTEYFNKESDIDIALLLNEKLDSKALFDLSAQLSFALKRDIDLVQLDKVSTVLQFQIIQTGKRIFCKDTIFCNRYESQIFCAYVELNEMRKPYFDEIKKTGKVLN
jgi:predicted nucleotidyltransferase